MPTVTAVMPLIAPKPIDAYGADEYYAYVQSMYELRTKGPKKPAPPALGLSVRRTKTGKLSVTRRAKTRPFAYVTLPEIAALATATGCNQSDLWNLFKQKEFIVAKDRMTAEQAYAKAKGVKI